MPKSSASVIKPDPAGQKDQDSDAHLLTFRCLPGLTLLREGEGETHSNQIIHSLAIFKKFTEEEI